MVHKTGGERQTHWLVPHWQKCTLSIHEWFMCLAQQQRLLVHPHSYWLETVLRHHLLGGQALQEIIGTRGRLVLGTNGRHTTTTVSALGKWVGHQRTEEWRGWLATTSRLLEKVTH